MHFFYCAARTPAWAYGLVQTVSNFSFAIWFGLGWVAFCSGLDWFGLEKHISRLKLVWVECTVALVWGGFDFGCWPINRLTYNPIVRKKSQPQSNRNPVQCVSYAGLYIDTYTDRE